MTDRRIRERPGIGPKSALRLAEAGIGREAALRRPGAVAARRLPRHRNLRLVTCEMPWGRPGALAGPVAGRIDAAAKTRLPAEAGA
jgi:hypothetical protein